MFSWHHWPSSPTPSPTHPGALQKKALFLSSFIRHNQIFIPSHTKAHQYISWSYIETYVCVHFLSWLLESSLPPSFLIFDQQNERERAKSLLHRVWLMPFMAGNLPRTDTECNRSYSLLFKYMSGLHPSYKSCWKSEEVSRIPESQILLSHLAVGSLRKKTSGISKEQIFQTTDCSLCKPVPMLPTHLPTRGLLECCLK